MNHDLTQPQTAEETQVEQRINEVVKNFIKQLGEIPGVHAEKQPLIVMSMMVPLEAGETHENLRGASYQFHNCGDSPVKLKLISDLVHGI